MKKKTILILSIALIAVVLAAVGTSYALFRYKILDGDNFKILVGNLELDLSDNMPNSEIVINNLVPMKETTAMAQEGYTFTLTNTGSINSNYTMYLDDIEPTGEVKQRIPENLIKINLTNNNTNESNTYTLSELTDRVLDMGNLNTSDNKTVNYTLRIWLDINADNSNQNKYFAVKIRVVGVQENQRATYNLKNKILLDNNDNIIKTAPTLGVKTSETNENGLYKMSVTNGYGGSDGDTYYFRGNVTNNVVEFAGFTWRIVRINEDGTIRLILDEFINENINSYGIYRFYQDNNAGYNYMYYSNTSTEGDPEFPNIKYVVDKWYKENITDKGYGNKVASGNYFCEAANVVENDGFRTLEGTNNMITRPNYTPTLKCIEDSNGHQYVSGPVGLITYDEASYAGAVSYIPDNTYYLNTNANGDRIVDNISSTWWTMTPGGINTNDNNIVYVWAIDNAYDLTEFYIDYKLHVRPVINLKSDTYVSVDENTGHYIVGLR